MSNCSRQWQRFHTLSTQQNTTRSYVDGWSLLVLTPSRPLTSDHSPFHSSSKSSFTPPMQTPDTLEQMYVCVRVCVGRLPRRWRCVRGNDRSRDICTPPQPIIAMFPAFLAPLDEPPPPLAIGVRRSFCFVCLRLPSLCLTSARPYPTPFLYLPRVALSLGISH